MSETRGNWLSLTKLHWRDDAISPDYPLKKKKTPGIALLMNYWTILCMCWSVYFPDQLLVISVSSDECKVTTSTKHCGTNRNIFMFCCSLPLILLSHISHIYMCYICVPNHAGSETRVLVRNKKSCSIVSIALN